MARICIYGAGSVGCYIGGRLLASGSDISFIGRPRIGDELREHGLTLSHYQGGHWQVPPAAIAFSTEAAGAAGAELVLVTVKSADTAAAAAELAGLLRPGAVVISFQNGLGNAEILRAALPEQVVLEGIVPFNVVARGPGAFHQASEGRLEVKAAFELKPFLAAFDEAGLPLIRQLEIVPMQWAKLLINLNNAINALANLPLKEELSHRAYRRCLALAQAEALALLKRAGIRPARLTPLPASLIPTALRLPDALFSRLGRTLLAIDPLARSSMSDDLAAGRQTEVDWINGEVTRLAERLGRRAPVNASLCRLVHAAEQAGERPRWSGAALLAELRKAVASPS